MEMTKLVCDNCRKEIKHGSDTGFFPTSDKFNIGKFGVVYCPDCAYKATKDLENALHSVFNGK